MNSLRDFFMTDWTAMTRTDWTGLMMVLVLTVLMIAIYFWTFRPKNREHFEQYRNFVNSDEDCREVDHGQTR